MMKQSSFHMKYAGHAGETSRRPPSGLPQTNMKSSSTTSILTAGERNNDIVNGTKTPTAGEDGLVETNDRGWGSPRELHESRPGSRACTPREERTGIANQYRKPWIRPHSTGPAVAPVNERRRQMEKYRGDRPKSSPVLRRHRSPPPSRGPGMSYSRSSSRPGSSRRGSRILISRSSTSLLASRRKGSVADSDVEEIVADQHTTTTSSSTPGSGEQVTVEQLHRVSPSLGRGTHGNGWTTETAVDVTSPPASEKCSREKRLPTLSKPRMQVSADESLKSSGDVTVDVNDNVEKPAPRTDERPKLLVEPDIDNRSDSCLSDDARSQHSAVSDTHTHTVGGRRPRSESRASVDGKRGSRPTSPAGEGMVRRARKERRRKLLHYQNTRLNRGAETARQRLRRIFSTVRVIASICLALKSYVKKEETTQWSLHEMNLNLRADFEKNLAFDLIMFSKLRVTRGSEKLKSILALRPEQRTRPDIEIVLALLRKNKAFSEYQKETQIGLIKYMEYLRFEPRRIVLKEGHVASGFYIILSGTCLVNQREVDPRNNQPFVRTVTQLSSGEAFGEYSLLHDTERSASVVCKDEVEVLLINKDDFDEVIRKPIEQKRDELIEFCHSHDIYISATAETLLNQPRAIYTKFFKPGVLITEDIMTSEYIYVVKEGKCHVVAEIKEMKRQGKKGDLHPRLLMQDESWKKDAALKRSMAVLANSSQKRRNWSSAARNKLYPPEKREKTFFSLNALDVKDSTDEYFQERKKSVQMAFEEPPKFLLDAGENIKTKKKDVPAETDGTAISRTWKRVTMTANALSQREEKDNPVEYAPSNKIKTTYARLANLKSGMAFGIESLLPGTQPEAKLSLVSEGAEVILVSKRLFASDVSSTTLKTASKMAVDYPSIEFTREVMEDARVWNTYKADLVKEIYGKKLDRRPVQPRR